jgi:hypothetical protein
MLSHPIRSSLLSPYAAQAKTTYQNLEREEKRKRREEKEKRREREEKRKRREEKEKRREREENISVYIVATCPRLRMYYMRLKIGDVRYDIGDTR